MKTKKMILATLAATLMISFTTTTALAHSGHDHSMFPHKWEFTKDLKAKVERNMNSANPTGKVGLNPVEQKKLDHYGIAVGNYFKSTLRGMDITVQRTSAGIRIIDAKAASHNAHQDTLPIKRVATWSNTSMGNTAHAGHDHSNLPYEWIFAESTQAKLISRMVQSKGNVVVGLTGLEQDMLDEYNINVGNTFQTSLAGHVFTAERTASGLKIINHVETASVAMNHSASQDAGNNM